MISVAHHPEHHVRDRLVLEYKQRPGDPETLKLPRWKRGVDGNGKSVFVELTLKPGDNPDVPTAYFHAIGGDPAVSELIASGAVRAVCRDHVFDDQQPACRYCGKSNPLY